MAKSLGQGIVLMARRTANIKQLSQKFFAKNQAKYHTIGLTRLWTDVYWKFPEGEYKRTKNLLNSFSSDLIPDGMKIFLNETDAIAAKKPGEYKYYPSYVSLGTFFKYQGEPRNIPTGWKDALENVVTEDFKNEVHNIVMGV